MGIKIKYHVIQTLTFMGEVEVDEDTYEAMHEFSEADNETALGELILDHIDQNDPQRWEIEAVDEFSKVE